MSNEEREAMPQGWEETTFEELNSYRGGNVDPADHAEEVFELYSVPNFPKGVPEFLSGSEIGSTKQLISPNDVLVCKINPRINRVWKVNQKGEKRQIGSSEWIVFRSPGTHADFFKQYFQSDEFRELLCADVTGVGGSLTRAQPSRVATFPVPLPPLPEQIRIADKLDALLARVEAGRERLERVPKLLKQFRQAVLSAAVSGELTREWRGTSELHTQAPELKAGSDVPETELPEGWIWTSAEHIKAPEKYSLAIGPFGSNLVASEYQSEGIPLIFVREIRARKFNLPTTRFISEEKAASLSQHIVKPGDLLITKMGDPPGDTAIYPLDSPRGVITSDCIKLSVNQAFALTKYLFFAIESPEFRSRLPEITAGVAQQKISLERFKDFPIELPPLPEQAEIVRRVEALFSLADRLDARYQSALASYSRLTPSILAKAFRGELVPQDPADEPASLLLERIRAQRAASGAGRKRGRGPRAQAAGEGGEGGNTPKRRGRPPKAQAEGLPEETEPRRRGRPPKVASTVEEAIGLLEARKRAAASEPLQPALIE